MPSEGWESTCAHLEVLVEGARGLRDFSKVRDLKGALAAPIRYGTHIKKVNVLRAYYTYGYGRTTLTATGILRLRLRAYDAYGYGHATLMATGVLGLRLWAYYTYGYGRIAATTTVVLQAYYGFAAGCKLTSGHYNRER